MSKENPDASIESYLFELIFEIEKRQFSPHQIIPRNAYNLFYQSFSKLRGYLSDYGILNFLNSTLMKINIVSEHYNPYPVLYKEIIPYCNSKLKNQTIYEKQPQPTNMKYLFKKTSYSYEDQIVNNIYGQKLIKNCNPDFLSVPRKVSTIIMPGEMKTLTISPSDDGLSFQVYSIISLRGQSIFLGSVIQFVESLTFTIHFFATTSETQVVSNLYYDAVDTHMQFMMKSASTIILQINVPFIKEATKSDKKKNVKKYTIFQYNDWKNEKMFITTTINKFLETQSSTKTGEFNTSIFAELILPTNMISESMSEDFQKIQIEYAFNTLRQTESKDGTEIWSVSNSTRSSLLCHLSECIFLHQADAQALMALVLNILVKSDQTNSKTSKNKSSGNQNSEILNILSADLTIVQPNTLFGLFKFADDDLPITDKGKAETKKLKPQSEKMSNNSWKMEMKTVENQWIDRIVKSRKEFEFFLSLEYIMKLVLVESDLILSGVDSDILKKEIVFIFNSLAYKVFIVIQMNITLRQAIYSFNEHKQIPIVLKMLETFISKFQSLLLVIKTHGYSSFTTILAVEMESRIHIFFDNQFFEDLRKASIIHPRVLLELGYYNSVCSFLLWQYVGDLLLNCKQVKQLIENIRNRYDPQNQKQEILINSAPYAKELESFIIKSNKAKDKSKSKISVAEIVQILDKKLFPECWEKFLLNLVQTADLISDPFLLLSYHFQNASAKLAIILSPETSKFKFPELKLVNPDCHLYKAKDVELYGLKSAILPLNIGALKKMINPIKIFDHTAYDRKCGDFEMTICTGLLGQLSLYDNIRKLEFVDNIYVLGFNNCVEETSQSVTQIIIKHILEISKKSKSGGNICLGLFVKGSLERWSINSILENQHETVIQISKYVQTHGLYTKIFIPNQWRFLPVTKYFQFHFIPIENPKIFFPNRKYKDIETFRLIFLNQESAEAYLNINGYLKLLGDPFSAINLSKQNMVLGEIKSESVRSQNWMQYHEAMLTAAVISEDVEVVKKAKKVLFGGFGQLEFLNTFNKSIQNAIFGIIEAENYFNESSVNQNLEKNTAPVSSYRDILYNSFQCYYYSLYQLFQNDNLYQFHIWPQILSLLNAIEFSSSNSKNIIPNSQNIHKLEELRQILKALELVYGKYSCD